MFFPATQANLSTRKENARKNLLTPQSSNPKRGSTRVYIMTFPSVTPAARQSTQSKSQEKIHSIVDAPQWLAAIVEHSDDAIIGQSLDGIITSWNKSAERIFGYTASEAIGEPISLLAWPGTEEDMPQLIETIRRGERVDHYETLRRHKNGTKIFVSLTLSGILDADGKIVGISKISRDISARKAADETLIRQARLLDEVYEPILIRTLDDRIVYWNKGAERVYGWKQMRLSDNLVAICSGRSSRQPWCQSRRPPK